MAAKPAAAPARQAKAPGPAATTAAVISRSSPSQAISVIREDGLPLAEGQITRSRFMADLAASVRAAADEELAPVGRTAADCPYIDYWLNYYKTKPPDQIEAAIWRYARPAKTNSESLMTAVVERARAAIRQWRSGGPASPGLLRPGLDGLALGGAGVLDDVARLGGGAPLEAEVRARMEALFERRLGAVRIHEDDAGNRLASEASAYAVTFGNDIAFASGRYQPGTIGGDALIAHELAHTHQQSAGVGAETSTPDNDLEAEASASMVGALGGPVLAPAPARTGLRLQRCSEDIIVTPRDWREQNRAEYEAAVAKIRELYARQKSLTDRPGWDDARAKQMDDLQKEMDDQVRILQRMGILRGAVDIRKRLLGKEPEDLRRIGAETGILTGDDPDKIFWGEHRRFRLQLLYIPVNVDVRIEWEFYAGAELTTVTPSKEKGFSKESFIELDDDFWAKWVAFGPADNKKAGKTNNPGFELYANVWVGGDSSPTWVYKSKWLHLTTITPHDLKIVAPRIMQMPSAAAEPAKTRAAASTTPAPAPPTPGAGRPTSGTSTAAPSRSPTSGAAPTTDYVLEGADVEMHLNLTAQGAGTDTPEYKIVWSVEDFQAQPKPERRYPPWFQTSEWILTPGRNTLEISFSAPIRSFHCLSFHWLLE